MAYNGVFLRIWTLLVLTGSLWLATFARKKFPYAYFLGNIQVEARKRAIHDTFFKYILMKHLQRIIWSSCGGKFIDIPRN
jgi:hypothetical protein